ncbi:MAG: hypothetical protein NTY12_01745 [Candidatus Falkowbacteria bacterium]|nr:hypothetical protein [Candidatus Falkowbacteria bacterium]
MDKKDQSYYKGKAQQLDRLRKERRKIRGIKREIESGKGVFYYLRKATAKDYDAWLDGFFKKGGKQTHYYNYSILQTDYFYVAIKDFSLLKPLRGSSAIRIIVPHGLNFLGGDLGHCTIYFMKDYEIQGHQFVPVFKN